MKPMSEHHILILTGSLGEGHNQAARAIVESAKRNSPHLSVKVVDYMELTHPRLHVAGQYFFIQWMKHFPSLYGYLFQKTREDNSLIQLLKRLSSFSLQKLSGLLEDVKPSVVVSTFPPAAAGMSLLKAMGLTDVPVVTVITDHTDHSYWIHSHTDHYMVGSHVVMEALQRKGIPGEHISVTGIPVHPRYAQPVDRDRLRPHYGLDSSHKAVLVMGGGEGMIDDEIIELLQSRSYPEHVRFLVVCGRNEKLFQTLQAEFVGEPQVTVMGYVDRMHELMAISDLMLTKPGGLTVSEALTMELPMLLFKPVPGQEQDNADYLVGIGVAQQAAEGGLQERLTELLRHSWKLSDMRQNAKLYGHKDSALSVLTQLIALIRRHPAVRDWAAELGTGSYGTLARDAYMSDYQRQYADSYR